MSNTKALVLSEMKEVLSQGMFTIFDLSQHFGLEPIDTHRLLEALKEITPVKTRNLEVTYYTTMEI